ncbi:hypothetical protein GGR53DRAFT_529261 [Hypoxylon sp. FL1150]|nr:hypothetical protein GGR53DRAFT_529261 [Hypoxylon sp. FL1150]
MAEKLSPKGTEMPIVTKEQANLAANADMKEKRRYMFTTRIPEEVSVMIFEELDDLSDVQAIVFTCHEAYRIYKRHEGAIVKSKFLNVITRSPFYKLPLMAYASRDVDPTDRNSIEQFFRRYIWMTDPWPNTYFTLKGFRGFYETLELVGSAEGFVMNLRLDRSPDKNHPIYGDNTELDRMVATALMVETAANLFHRMPSKHGEFIGIAAHRQLEYDYWAAFSQSEWNQVKALSGLYPEVLGKVLKFAKDGWPSEFDLAGLCEQIHDMHSNCRCPQHEGALMFAYMIGADHLSSYETWDPDDIAPHPVAWDLRAFLDTLPLGPSGRYVTEFPEEFMTGENHRERRFQPDNYVVDDETLERLERDGPAKFFNCRGARLLGNTTVLFWDKESLETYGEQWRKIYHPTMGDYVSDDEASDDWITEDEASDDDDDDDDAADDN